MDDSIDRASISLSSQAALPNRVPIHSLDSDSSDNDLSANIESVMVTIHPSPSIEQKDSYPFIPPELVRIIFEFAGAQQFIRLSHVCRLWHSVSLDPKIWKDSIQHSIKWKERELHHLRTGKVRLKSFPGSAQTYVISGDRRGPEESIWWHELSFLEKQEWAAVLDSLDPATSSPLKDYPSDLLPFISGPRYAYLQCLQAQYDSKSKERILVQYRTRLIRFRYYLLDKTPKLRYILLPAFFLLSSLFFLLSALHIQSPASSMTLIFATCIAAQCAGFLFGLSESILSISSRHMLRPTTFAIRLSLCWSRAIIIFICFLVSTIRIWEKLEPDRNIDVLANHEDRSWTFLLEPPAIAAVMSAFFEPVLKFTIKRGSADWIIGSIAFAFFPLLIGSYLDNTDHGFAKTLPRAFTPAFLFLTVIFFRISTETRVLLASWSRFRDPLDFKGLLSCAFSLILLLCCTILPSILIASSTNSEELLIAGLLIISAGIFALMFLVWYALRWKDLKRKY